MEIAELTNGNYRIAVPYFPANGNTGTNYDQRLYTAELTSLGTVVSGTEKIFKT